MAVDRNDKRKLLSVLENLHEYPFKKFKSCLETTDYEQMGSIPRRELEKADPVDLVNLMYNFYTEAHTESVCIRVLEEINEREIAAKLKGRTQESFNPAQIPGTSANEVRLVYRDYVLKHFQRIIDCNSRLGEYVLLNHRYSELIILTHHRSEEEREHEIMSTGRKHVQILKERTSSSIAIESLFRPDENGLIPEVVVLQGAAGIGKTMTAKKIMLDCACGKLYQDMFDYTFYIDCRQMNLHTEDSSVTEVILKSWADKDWSEEILRNPARLLFVIDGFDELRCSFDQQEDCLCTDPWKKQPVGILLSSLFRRKLLPKSYLLITSRPTAQDQLRQCLKFSRYAEILGFSEKERREYFYKFFREPELATQAFGLVKQNETLFTMCFVPIVCWIVCTVMKQQMKKCIDLTQSSNTLTSLYILYLYMLKSHHNQSNQFTESNLKGLCSLALDGIRKRQILFWEDEIRKRGLDQEDSLPLFLSMYIFQKDIDCECAYSFIHLSFQEFFAALSYILDEEYALNCEKHDPDLKTLLETVMTSRRDFELIVRFIFGLLNEEKIKDLGKKFGWKISPKIKDYLLDWVKNNKKPKISGNDRDHKLLLECLHEIQDEKFVKLAMSHVTEIIWNLNTEMEEKTLAYCLEHCCSLEELYLQEMSDALEEDMTVEKERGLLTNSQLYQQNRSPRCGDLFIKPLKSLNSNLRSLWLNQYYLTEVGCKDLAHILSKNPTLKEFGHSNTKLENTGMKLLCEGLEHCKLEKLWLCNASFTGACCVELAQAVSYNETLKELDLSGNKLKDFGMKLLCEGLNYPDSKLEKLGLFNCSLTGACCDEVAQLLSKSQKLKELELSGNKLEDAGMKILLSKGLNHPGCKLKKLQLYDCCFTGVCCEDFAKILSKIQTLRKLDLRFNNIEDNGMKLLCEGLEHLNSKLELLLLEKCCLTETCCQDLARVLCKNQSLKKLHLSGNELKDTGIKQLCEGLQHPDCKLETLLLEKCCLTEACCKELAQVLQKNQRLQTLSLSNNELKDTGMKHLCEGLQHTDCKLESLSLENCGVTATFLEDFSIAIIKNQSLTDLIISGIELRDSETKMLHEALKFSCSKRQSLSLNVLNKEDDSTDEESLSVI